jgi:tripartite-type tricarboxylate transporter receptor subunit TctC
MASAGSGSSQHMAGELFKMMAGIDGACPTAARRRRDRSARRTGQVMFDNLTSSVRHVRRRPTAWLGGNDRGALGGPPDLPIVGDFVRATGRRRHLRHQPAGTQPPDIVDKLNRRSTRRSAIPGSKARLADLGGLILSGTSVDFAKVLAEEVEKWGKVVKFSGAKPG